MSETPQPDPYKLQSIGCDMASIKATTGKFRSIICIDSESYRVGEDWNTIEEAMIAIRATYSTGCTVQIYNDQGEPLVP